LLKQSVPPKNITTTRNRFSAGSGIKPISYSYYGSFGLILVGTDIMTGKIGNKFLVSILLSIENEGALLLLSAISKTGSPNKNSQFKRHIKTRKL